MDSATPGSEDPAPAQDADNTRLVRLNRELQILNAIAEDLNRAVALDETLQSTLARVADLLGLRAGWVWLLDETTEKPELAVAKELPPILRDEPRRMSGNCWCLDSFRDGDMEGAANVSVIECTRLRGLKAGTEGLHFHASIPLYAGDKRLGVLNVASEDWRELDADELRLLYTIGYQLGIAVERSRLHARAAQLAAAEERTRIARELHDSIAQSLAAIALQIETADALADRGAAQVRQTLHTALQLTRNALQEARAVMHDLRATALRGRRLPEALHDLAAAMEASYRVPVRAAASGACNRLTPHVEAGLYRIAQEAVSNACRHAHAGHVRIRLHATDTAAKLTVRDDGSGFDPEAERIVPTHSGGFGLLGMRERARLLGGTLSISSTPERGTAVTVRVPLG